MEQNGNSVLPFLVDATLTIEKARIAALVRQTHLKRQKRVDPDTDELLKRALELEQFLDNRIKELIQSHPAFSWFSRVKGTGGELIAKVVGLIEIDKANTISSLWKFAGFSVEDGKAPKAKTGEKLSFNKQLKSMCWRLAISLLKAKGKFYEYYLHQKEGYLSTYRSREIKIVPASALPTQNGKKFEPEGIISEGHVHNQALRKMIKLFLGCLWLAWREAEGLPIREPYPLERLGHTTLISPEEMTDRPAKKARRKSAHT